MKIASTVALKVAEIADVEITVLITAIYLVIVLASIAALDVKHVSST